MKCSNCGYVYSGSGNPSNCAKCGCNFGNNGTEESGLSTKSKIATGIGAAAGLAAGVGMLAYQNRDVVVDASENLSESGEIIVDSNLNIESSLENQDVSLEGTNSDVEDATIDSNLIVDSESETNLSSNSNSGNGIKGNDKIDSEKTMDVSDSKDEKNDDFSNNDTDLDDGKDDSNTDGTGVTDDSSNDNEQDSEETDSSGNDDSETGGTENSGDSETGSSGNSGNGNSSGESDDSETDEEDLTQPANTGGDSGSSGGGGNGIGDINFTPTDLEYAAGLFGLGSLSGKTLSDANACAGNILQTVKEASNLASGLNSNKSRTITANDLSSVVSSVTAVAGSGGYLTTVEKNTNRL